MRCYTTCFSQMQIMSVFLYLFLHHRSHETRQIYWGFLVRRKWLLPGGWLLSSIFEVWSTLHGDRMMSLERGEHHPKPITKQLSPIRSSDCSLGLFCCVFGGVSFLLPSQSVCWEFTCVRSSVRAVNNIRGKGFQIMDSSLHNSTSAKNINYCLFFFFY